MTAGGGGNAINLAALWVPVMPETSHIGEKMREAGTQARRSFEEGFGGGSSPETLGGSFGSRFMAGFSGKMGAANFGPITTAIDKLGEQVDAKLASTLRNQLPQSYRAASTAAQEFTQVQQRVTEVQERVAAAHQNVATAQAALTERQQRSQEVVRITNELNAQGVTYSEALAEAHRRTGTTENDLTAAHQRLAEAQAQVGYATRQQKTVEDEVTAARQRASAATEEHTGKLNEYQAASAGAFTASSALGGLVGGALVVGFQALTGAVEGFIHLGEHIFEATLEGAKELSDKLIEIGEDYANLNVQTVEFSGATGDALSDMQEHVATIFGQLDVAGKNLGQTYAQLRSMLGIKPGPELDDLARKVTDLQGRFGNLKAQDLGAIFRDFKVPVGDFNAALDTLVDNAAHAGESLGDLSADLKGKVGETLSQAGISLGNASWFLGELHRIGVPATDVVTGLSTAMAKLTKSGMDFPTAMREVVKELLNSTKAQQDEAEATLTGGRRWTEFAAALQVLNQALNDKADAHDGAADAAQREIARTEMLSNRIEEFKHHVETALAPFAGGVLKGLEVVLDRIAQWFDKNQTKIAETIRGWGHAFINAIPSIKQFAELSLGLLAIFTDGVITTFDLVEKAFVGFTEALSLPIKALNDITPDWAPGADEIRKMAKAFDQAVKGGKDLDKTLQDTHIGDTIRGWKQDLENFNPNLDMLNNGLDRLTDSAEGAGQAMHMLEPSQVHPSAYLGGGSLGGGGYSGPFGQSPSGTVMNAGSSSGAPGGGVQGVVYQAMLNAGFGPDQWPAVSNIVSHESSWSPTARNHSGAFGLGQFLGHEGDKYGAMGAYTTDPALQAAAMMEYIRDRYGTPDAAWAHWQGANSYRYGGPVGFDTGGSVSNVPGVGEVTTGEVAGEQSLESKSWPHVHPFDPNDPIGLKWRGTGQFNPNVRLDSSEANKSGWNSLKPYQQSWNLLGSGWEWVFSDAKPGSFGNSISRWFGRNMFASGGTGSSRDTIPAMLAPGEYVWNERAVSKFGPFIDWANRAALQGDSGWFTGGSGGIGAGLTSGILSSLGMMPKVKGFQGGGGAGSANYYASGAPDDDQGVTPEILGAEALAHQFGLKLTAGRSGHGSHPIDGGYHDSGEAGDFGNGMDTAEETAFAMYMAENFGSQLAELIHYDPAHGWDGSYNIKDGRTVAEYGGVPKVYDMGTLSGHNDHVHIAFKPGASPQLEAIGGAGGGGFGAMSYGGGGGGAASGFFTMPADYSGGGGGGGHGGGGGMPNPLAGGGPGGAFNPRTGLPGLSGQYGGYGAYGGETQDQMIERQRAVTQHERHIKELEKQRDRLQNQDIPRLEGELRQEQAKIPAMQDQARITNLTNEIQDRKDRLDEIKNEDLPEAQRDLASAQRKQVEAEYTSPKGLKGKGEKSKDFSLAEQLGKGLLSGIAEELGFPDVFGKAPWEFGAFKMFTKALGIGASWMQELGGGAGMGGGALPGIPGADEALAGIGGSGQFPVIPGMDTATRGLGAPGPDGGPGINLRIAPNLAPHTATPGPPSGTATGPREYPHGYPGPANSSPRDSVRPAVAHIDNRQTWNVQAGVPDDIAHALSTYAGSWDHAQHLANSPGMLPPR